MIGRIGIAIWLGLAVFLFAPVPVFAAIEVTSGTLDRDFGKVPRMKRLSCRTLLKNNGDKPLDLKRLQKSCGGCSPLSIDRMRVRPGESVTFTLRYEAGSKVGPQTRSQFVQVSGEGTSQTLKLQTRWTVEAYVDCQPESLDFGRQVVTEPWRGQLVLRSDGFPEPVTITRVETSSPTLCVGKTVSDPKARTVVIPVSLASDVPLGSFEAKITLHTSCKKDPVIEVPVTGTIVGPILPVPNYLNFAVVERGRELTREAVLDMRPAGRWKLTGLVFDRALLKAELTTNKRGKTVVRARLLATAPPGRVKSELVIKTDCPQQPEVRLPVIGLIK